MEYDVDRFKRILKIVGIALLMIALVGTCISLAFMFIVEQEKVSKLKDERVELENRLGEAEIKIVEQQSEINYLLNPVGVGDEELNDAKVVNTEDLVKNALSELQNGDMNTIKGWFGSGSEYTSENVAEYTKYTKITVTKDKKAPEGYISIHVCNLNNKEKLIYKSKINQEYIKKNVAMKEEDREELVNKKVTDKIKTGELDKHFSLYVKSTDNVLEITDELKQALTGGWYLGTSEIMTAYKCIYEN